MPDSILRLQCSMALDSSLPRDRVVITPHVRVSSIDGSVNAETLTNDLAVALNAWAVGGLGEVTVKAYDVEQAKPQYPLATKTLNPGMVKTSNGPRELACCLSFYSEQNVPRRRGRLFVPWPLIWESGSIPLRPSAPIRARVTALGTLLQNLGGSNVDWGVWSKRSNAFYTATHKWVDDEWDVQRRRGLRATTRDLSATGE